MCLDITSPYSVSYRRILCPVYDYEIENWRRILTNKEIYAVVKILTIKG
jgi:hypothetical protein